MSAKSITDKLPKTRSRKASASKSLSSDKSKSLKDRNSIATAKAVRLLASGSACAEEILSAYFLRLFRKDHPDLHKVLSLASP